MRTRTEPQAKPCPNDKSECYRSIVDGCEGCEKSEQTKEQAEAKECKHNRPDWLSEEDENICILEYRSGKKLGAIKMLYEVAKFQFSGALKWSKEYLEKVCETKEYIDLHK
jgi:hypothetical protein